MRSRFRRARRPFPAHTAYRPAHSSATRLSLIHIWDKVKEETAEVEAEMRSGDKANLEAEFGDLFFALVNAARLYGVDPESALERTNKKFIRRFNYMEEQAAAQGNSLHDLSLGEMEALWQEAKKGE